MTTDVVFVGVTSLLRKAKTATVGDIAAIIKADLKSVLETIETMKHEGLVNVSDKNEPPEAQIVTARGTLLRWRNEQPMSDSV